MKQPTKYDQRRAMREARYEEKSAVELVFKNPMQLALESVQAGPIIEHEPQAEAPPHRRKSLPAPKSRPQPSDTVTGDTVSDTVSWLAPEGQCLHCDKRRAALKASMRKRRAKAIL